MKVKELIEELIKLPEDMEVCCNANGFDNECCPSVHKVKIETMILLNGDYFSASGFSPESTKEDLKYQVVLLR